MIRSHSSLGGTGFTFVDIARCPEWDDRTTTDDVGFPGRESDTGSSELVVYSPANA